MIIQHERGEEGRGGLARGRRAAAATESTQCDDLLHASLLANVESLQMPTARANAAVRRCEAGHVGGGCSARDVASCRGACTAGLRQLQHGLKGQIFWTKRWKTANRDPLSAWEVNSGQMQILQIGGGRNEADRWEGGGGMKFKVDNSDCKQKIRGLHCLKKHQTLPNG